MGLNTIGSIATHIAETMDGLPAGVSGNLVIISDLARQHVANYAGEEIGSNDIGDKFEPAIVDFAKADTVDLFNANAGGENIKLVDLSISETGEAMSAEQYRLLGEMKLKHVGRKIRFARSLS